MGSWLVRESWYSSVPTTYLNALVWHAVEHDLHTATSTITPVIFTPTITPTATSTPPCGLAWNITNSPNPGPNNNSVNGIAAVSANNVWAVGSYSNASGMYTSFVLHWNGTAWA